MRITPEKNPKASFYTFQTYGHCWKRVLWFLNKMNSDSPNLEINITDLYLWWRRSSVFLCYLDHSEEARGSFPIPKFRKCCFFPVPGPTGLVTSNQTAGETPQVRTSKNRRQLTSSYCQYFIWIHKVLFLHHHHGLTHEGGSERDDPDWHLGTHPYMWKACFSSCTILWARLWNIGPWKTGNKSI